MSEKSPFEYGKIERLARKARRVFNPVQRSQWTAGPMPVEDIADVHLVPPEKLVSFFGDCITLLRDARGRDVGDYMEFGVFNGSSIGSLHRARRETGADMRLFGFDSFQGLPESAEGEDKGVWKRGFYQCSFEDTERSLRKRGVNPHDINWITGWYKETLTPQTAAFHAFNPGIVFIDCDTYTSSKTVLDFVAPLIAKPTIFCLDDWKLNDLDVKGEGEYKSFNEFVVANPHLEVTSLPSYNRKSRTFLVAPRAA